MSAKAGEVSRETALYRCENCHHRVTMKAGALIAPCAMCGHASYQTGWNRSVGPLPADDPSLGHPRAYSTARPMLPMVNGKPGID